MRRKKIAGSIAAALFLLLLGNGCENNGMEIGGNWVDPHTRIVLIDTCTVRLSSVMLDSVPTSAGPRIFSGVQRSSFWGTTKASSFLTFSITSDFERSTGSATDEKPIVRFDSLTLYLLPDSMFCGDTTRLMTLNLHRLTERVELNDQGKLYGHSNFAYEAVPIASKSFYPRPRRGKELEIRLPDELGKEFLDKLVELEEEMDDDESFNTYFNGMALVPGDASEALLGFRSADTTCMMKLYYHRRVGGLPVESEALFKLKPGLQFTRVESDRTGAPLEGITFKENEIGSSASDHKAFVQGLTGIYTKIEFPHLNKILERGTHGAVVAATLIVYPLAGSYEKQNYSSLPQTLQMYVSDETNVTTGAITDSNDQLQNGSLNYDERFANNTYYTYDVTDFIKGQLGLIGYHKRNLQMIGAHYGYTLNDLVVADQSSDRKNIELHITYAIYNE